jgi:hypothetical protein
VYRYLTIGEIIVRNFFQSVKKLYTFALRKNLNKKFLSYFVVASALRMINLIMLNLFFSKQDDRRKL